MIVKNSIYIGREVRGVGHLALKLLENQQVKLEAKISLNAVFFAIPLNSNHQSFNFAITAIKITKSQSNKKYNKKGPKLPKNYPTK